MPINQINHSTERFLRLHAVKEITGKSRSTIYADMKEGAFPQNFKVGPNSAVWRESDVRQWMAEQLKKAGIAAA